MRFIVFIIFLLVAFNVSAQPRSDINFFCETVNKSCEDEKCFVPFNASLFFNLRYLFDSKYLSENYIGDKELNLGFGSYPIRNFGERVPTVGYSGYAEVRDGPEAILAGIYTVDCDSDKKINEIDRVQLLDGTICKKIKKKDVYINRVSGWIEINNIHTDGSIKEIPVGKPYSIDYGKCSKTIDRIF